MSCQIIRRIILPAGSCATFPTLASALIAMVKDTSLAANITVTEMFATMAHCGPTHLAPLALYIEVGLVCLLFCTVLKPACCRPSASGTSTARARKRAELCCKSEICASPLAFAGAQKHRLDVNKGDVAIFKGQRQWKNNDAALSDFWRVRRYDAV